MVNLTLTWILRCRMCCQNWNGLLYQEKQNIVGDVYINDFDGLSEENQARFVYKFIKGSNRQFSIHFQITEVYFSCACNKYQFLANTSNDEIYTLHSFYWNILSTKRYVFPMLISKIFVYHFWYHFSLILPFIPMDLRIFVPGNCDFSVYCVL